jgi:hypothetical protein
MNTERRVFALLRLQAQSSLQHEIKVAGLEAWPRVRRRAMSRRDGSGHARLWHGQQSPSSSTPVRE